MNVAPILADAADDAVTMGIVGICLIVLALGAALVAGYLMGHQGDEEPRRRD